MKRVLLAIVLVSCASRMTRRRPEWESCVTDGASVRCRGKELARIECLNPASEWCGSLALIYTGGERVLLAPRGADLPEIARDASRIWFRDPGVRSDLWNVYDPQMGVTQQLDSYEVGKLRKAYPPPVSLWKGAAP